MTKRAEPNEHAERLRNAARAYAPLLREHCDAAAAEIERLTSVNALQHSQCLEALEEIRRLEARVRELESEVSDEDGVAVRLNCTGCKISFLTRIPVAKLELWAERHYGQEPTGPESKPDQETKAHTCGLPWTAPSGRCLGDPPCPACAPTLAEYAMLQETKGER